MQKVLIVIAGFATLVGVYLILLSFGVLEYNKDSRKAVLHVENSKAEESARKRRAMKLSVYSVVATYLSAIFLNEKRRSQHVYWINRLELKDDILRRLYTPEELCGRYLTPAVFSLLLIPIGFFFPIIILVPIFFCARLAMYSTSFNMKIAQEDEVIDDYFIDLYLLLYSKLRQGARARLQGTVENYIDTLETSLKSEQKEIMLRFSKHFLNLLSLYEDHQAIPKLREYYGSATIINFCNIAAQALQGVDNYENLLTFKMQLIERKANLMRKRSAKLCRQGEMSIYAIYGILLIFIVCGWISKLPQGMFQTMFGK